MDEKRVVIKEQSLTNLADVIREKSGSTAQMDIDEIVEVARELGTPELEELNATENGEYTPDAYGYSKVTVDVQPEQEEISITENGEYIPDTYGFSRVEVDVQPTLEELSVEANGEYTPTEYGYSKVTVNCPPGPPDEAFILKNDLSRLNWGGKWDWYFNLYGDKITTKDITSMNYAFSGAAQITRLPFVFNLTSAGNLANAFNGMTNLEECPKLRGTLVATTSLDLASLTTSCLKIKDFNDLFEPEMLDVYSTIKCTARYTAAKLGSLFSHCQSMRQLPNWFYKLKLCEESTAYPNATYGLYNNMINSCYSLDEALNIPVWRCTVGQTNNMFSTTFSDAFRLKRWTFETDDGQPIVTQWSNQTITISRFVGYTSLDGYLTEIGFTEDTHVKTDEDYQALKNNPDYWASHYSYGRYNHDSAVETINSLPDTSAYLATAGGTNTISFTGNLGGKTDGGAINTLTAEEIAVAAAKGWTVTLV